MEFLWDGRFANGRFGSPPNEGEFLQNGFGKAGELFVGMGFEFFEAPALSFEKHAEAGKPIKIGRWSVSVTYADGEAQKDIENFDRQFLICSFEHFDEKWKGGHRGGGDLNVLSATP
jgi:hypothetical protein